MPQQAPTSQENQPLSPTSPSSEAGTWFKYALATIVVVAIAVGALAYWRGSTREEVSTPVTKKIGILSFRQFNDVVAGFKPEMERLGYRAEYIEEISIPGPTMMQSIDEAVRRMVAADVDAIWASLEMQAKKAVEITKELGRTDIPIVFMTRFHDPVEYGLIESFQSSGNNATGVATDLREIIQRNLGFLKEINPNFKKLGVFTDGFMVVDIGGEYYKELVRQAPSFDIQLVEYKTSAPPPQAESEFNRIAATIKKGDIDGLFHIAGHFYGTQEKGESALAIRLGIPMVAPYEDLPNGGLFSYSDDFGESGKQTARILDLIFKGTHPSQIPIAYTAKNVLTLMTDRAKAAGIIFPESMEYIATYRYTDDSDFVKNSLVH